MLLYRHCERSGAIPALLGAAAVALARLCGAKAWLHVQDFEVDAAFSMGLLRGERIRSLVTAAECWLMRRLVISGN